LDVFNDTFSGTAVKVIWKLAEDSANGEVVTNGEINVMIPLGYIYTNTITFSIPNAIDGTSLYLVLSTQKSGVPMFVEDSEKLVVMNQIQLKGTAFGTSPPYAPGREYYRATDGDLNTFFDYANPSGGDTGIDLGAGNASHVSSIIYSPRVGFESRMVGGVFQGSNDGTHYNTLYTITAVPTANTCAMVNGSLPYRYLRYVGPVNSYCNIAEMAFYSR
jgi:hypothetical protein